MNISETHIKLSDETEQAIKNKQDPFKINGLLAYCSIIIDEQFVINDMKIINGYRGTFIAMPNRKISTRWKCGHKNTIDASFCNQCGKKTSQQPVHDDQDEQRKYVDICHPISADCRQIIHNKIMDAFNHEISK